MDQPFFKVTFAGVAFEISCRAASIDKAKIQLKD
jgi:hypothetical protein